MEEKKPTQDTSATKLSGGTSSSRKKIVIAAVCAAVAVVVVAAVAIGIGGQPQQQEPSPSAAQVAEENAHEVAVLVVAEGAEDAAAPARCEVLDGEGDAVIAESEVPANEETAIGELPPGGYALRMTGAPVLADGSTYELPEGPVEFEVDDGGEVVVTVELERIAADDMTKEQLEAAAAELEEAGNADAASAARDKAAGAPSVAGSGSSVSAEPTDPPAQEAPQGGGSTPGAPSGGSSSGGSSSSGNSSSQPPAHVHDWVAQTEQRWVPNNVWVVDQAAWDEVVLGDSYILCSCGATFDSNAAWSAHSKEAVLAGDYTHSYSVETEKETIHHDEVGHYEDQGHYETVTTGYRCSECGATK